jgi:trans-2,3-dihydro-3-hydroxyanthranilate isomerase
MGGLSVEVIMVEACLRDGAGGSPTAVVINGVGLDDVDLARIPSRASTSHVAVVYPSVRSGGRRALRCFTAAGALPGCGHGTVAAIAVLALRGTLPGGREGFQGLLCLAGQDLEATGSVKPDGAGGDVVEA